MDVCRTHVRAWFVEPAPDRVEGLSSEVTDQLKALGYPW
jgi:hypothetical protein